MTRPSNNSQLSQPNQSPVLQSVLFTETPTWVASNPGNLNGDKNEVASQNIELEIENQFRSYQEKLLSLGTQTSDQIQSSAIFSELLALRSEVSAIREEQKSGNIDIEQDVKAIQSHLSNSESGVQKKFLDIQKRLLDALPEEKLSIKLARYQQKGVRQIEELQGAKLYVTASGMSANGSGEHTFNLDERIQQFFESKTKCVFLLLGNAGAGKSTYSRHLIERLVRETAPHHSATPIPLFINLPSLKSPKTI